MTLTLETLFSVVILTLTTLAQGIIGQKIPSSNSAYTQFQLTHTEILYDTKALPDGTEVMSFLYKGDKQRFYFIVDEDESPLIIKVTPCASPLEFKLYHGELPVEERSGSGQVETDEFLQQKRAILPTTTPTSSRPLTLQEGDSIMSYTAFTSSSGLYVIEVTALTSDTSIRLYASTTQADHSYPEIPIGEDAVTVTSVSETSVHVSWEPSPSDALHNDPIEYCVMINQEKNMKTMCAAEAYMHGNSAPKLPPNLGFGFTWEGREKKRRQESRISAADPSEYFFICIGTKTSYAFSDLQFGETYYVDVFAVNQQTNQSTAYNGTSFETPSHPSMFKEVQDGRITFDYIKKSRSRYYMYNLTQEVSELLFSVQPCSGHAHVQISRDDDVITSGSASKLRRFILENPILGEYKICVTGSRRQGTSYKVFVSNNHRKYPYPKLPEDTSIKSFENLRKCNSVTVAWLSTRETSRYCLYRREIHSNQISDFYLKPDQCIAPESRRRSEKVMCRRFRYKERRRSAVVHKIEGLKPNKQYVIDVYVTKRHGGQTLSLQTTAIRTRQHCDE
ncbi:protein NDNF [Lingula anatina]|uniref:Protein NDNF n=1 Tax=Lingula anatina TaxID=7574 RepID=A0A1S3JDH2_LINAN|nr:protein NDNF [Lingula anatina]XP_013408465.1 protein NDNF [Lingula anatina]XP_013408466.1 protein NDNF [Lingula anatina]|eukprot:XP_013408464.1 protein NDNF [Lingula anatina]